MNRSANDIDGRDRCVVFGHPIPQGVADRIALLLAKPGGLLLDIADECFAPLGIGRDDYPILAVLEVDEPGTQHELAMLVEKAPGMLVASIDRLEQAGLVARTRDPADRRRSRVTLTAAGRRTLRKADAIAEQTVGELLSGLDAGELAQLQALLAKGLRLPDAQAKAA